MEAKRCIWNTSRIERLSVRQGAKADEQGTGSMDKFVLEPPEFVGRPLQVVAQRLALL